MTKHNDDYAGKRKTIRIPCEQCAKEFEFDCPLKVYETIRAAYEEHAQGAIFTGKCPECRKDDPFLTALDKWGITRVATLKRNKVSKG